MKDANVAKFVKVELLCCSRTEIGTHVHLFEPVSSWCIRKYPFSEKQVYKKPIVVPGTLPVFNTYQNQCNNTWTVKYIIAWTFLLLKLQNIIVASGHVTYFVAIATTTRLPLAIWIILEVIGIPHEYIIKYIASLHLDLWRRPIKSHWIWNK